MMEKINRNNYELYFVDYLDGNLTDCQVKEMFDFLEENSDLKEELKEISEFELQPDESVQFPNKNKLKKNTRYLENLQSNYLDELCIASIEGDLSETEQREFNTLLENNNELENTLELYKKTILQPDKNIQFPGKDNLKKEKAVISLPNAIQRTIAYAAGLLLLISLSVNILTNTSNDYDNYLTNNNIYNTEEIGPGSISSNSIDMNNNINNLNIDYNSILFKPSVETPVSIQQENMQLQKPLFASLENADNTKWNGEQIKTLASASSITLDNNASQSEMVNNNKLLALDKINSQAIKNKKFTLLDIADLGFRGIHKLTGKDWEIKRYYNQDGELKKLALKAESFAFTTNIKN
jgi:hypothetical protein